jgi:hypothetical protein
VIRIELKLGRLRFGESQYGAAPGQQLTYSGNDVENDRMPLCRLRAPTDSFPVHALATGGRTDVGGLFLAGGSCGMERRLVETRAILTDALRSFAVAVAIVLLGHFMIWLVAEGVMLPDAFGGTPTPFQDQAEAP